MIGSEIRPNSISLQPREGTVSETQTYEYMIDCYPYTMRGFLWGLLFSIVFVGSAIAILAKCF
jgi:hypothetical protein